MFMLPLKNLARKGLIHIREKSPYCHADKVLYFLFIVAHWPRLTIYRLDNTGQDLPPVQRLSEP